MRLVIAGRDAFGAFFANQVSRFMIHFKTSRTAMRSPFRAR
jgi:hypothetical protein